MELIGELHALLSYYQNLVVAGAQWGDEGKGKITAFLADFFDFVFRFSGAANAGHTAYTADGRKVVSHLIPCGLTAKKPCIIGRGVMFDSVRFKREYFGAVRILGKDMPEVLVDHQCTLWTPWHAILETWIETRRVASGEKEINSTGRGVGPMAGLRAMRCDIKVCDLLGRREKLLEKLIFLYETLEPILESVKGEVPTPSDVADQLLASADLLNSRVTDTSYQMCQALTLGKRLLGETAQATMLDLLWGTYPYVSSGMSTAAGAAYGAGIPPKAIGEVLLVAKFLPTRVGEGPFPSEMWNRAEAERFPQKHPGLFVPGSERDEFLARNLSLINQETATLAETSQYFQVLGDERGASTGRGRSVGNFDCPILRYAQRINGARYLALTRLDMMSGLKRIPIVVDYQFRGSKVNRGAMPQASELDEVVSQTECLPGWDADIRSCTREDDLPQEARSIIRRIEAETNMHILLVGTGPGRNDIIIRPPTD